MSKKWKKVSVMLLVFSLAILLVACGGGGTEPEPGPEPDVDTGAEVGAGTIQRYEDTPMALTELINGGIDAVVADSPVVLEFIANNPQANLKAFGDPMFEKEFYGMAMRQEDEDIHQLINEGLQATRDDGTYDRIFNKWFGDGEDFEVAESDNSMGLTLNVAQDMAYAPFEYINDAGEPEGFDVDLIRAIAAAQGFEVNLVNTAWDGIIPSLLANNSDIIISAMTITEERKESVTFSDPYFEATQYIAVHEDSPINSLSDLQGKSVGVQNGTTGDFAISDYFDSLE